jgi:hypothetical protein
MYKRAGTAQHLVMNAILIVHWRKWIQLFLDGVFLKDALRFVALNAWHTALGKKNEWDAIGAVSAAAMFHINPHCLMKCLLSNSVAHHLHDHSISCLKLDLPLK